MRKKIILFNFIIVTLSLLGLFLFGISVISEAHYKEAENRIIEITEVYVQNYNDDIAKTAPEGIRVTVISADGKVLSDSSKNEADKLENHAKREEVDAAYANSPKIVTRYSTTLGKDMVYYAKKAIINSETNDFVVVRTAIAVESVNDYVLKIAATSFYILLAALFLSLIASYFAADGLIKPLKEVSKNLKAVNDGTYKRITLVNGDEEVNAVLAEINEISEKLLTSINVAKENESRLDYILNNVSDGIIVLNGEGNVEISNKNASQIFNVEKPQGKNYEVLTENALFNDNVGKFLGGEKIAPFEMEIDGEKTFYTSINRLENGFIIIVLSDITAVKNAEKARSEFFANAGHELKTPLTAIKGFNDLICLNAHDEIKDLSQKIDKEVTRIIGLINDMLSLSRLDAEKPDKTEVNDLVSISRSVKESLAPLCEKKQVKIEISGEGLAKIEKEHAIELIKNLVENGVRYNDDGGYVKVDVARQNGGVSLVVTDNGIGIEPEHLGRVFERFYRVNKSRSRETGGTGLGLAIVKHICALYGADIKLESKLGVGTKVSVFIPD